MNDRQTADKRALWEERSMQTDIEFSQNVLGSIQELNRNRSEQEG